MTVQTIIKEAMERNPVSMKEALAEELRSRVALALEAKMNPKDDDEEDGLEESASKYGVDTGPLMKANAWIKPAKLSVMANDEELEGDALAVGYITKPGSAKKQSIAVLIRDPESFKRYFKHGMNKPHSFYYDTGRGHRQTQEDLTFTGIVQKKKGGEVETVEGKADMNTKTTLMVFN